MLTDIESGLLVEHLAIPGKGKDLLSSVRSSEPERRVASSRIASNVSGTFPSRKMGRTIQFESHSVELRAILTKYEYDSDCLEYWDQPFTIEGLVYEGKNGKKVRSKHTPDFLVVTSHGIYVDEWKPEHKLLALEEMGGSRFRREEDGTWRFPAAEKWCEEQGFTYRVRIDKELNRFLVQNVEYLRDYLDPKARRPSPDAVGRIEALVRSHPWVSLKTLLGSGLPADDLLYLIARGDLIADLENQLLHDIENAYIYRCLDDREAHRRCRSEEFDTIPELVGAVHIEEGTAVLWDGKPWIVANLGNSSVFLKSDSETATSLENEHFQSLIASGKIVVPRSKSRTKEIESLVPEYLQRPPEAYKEALRRMEILKKLEQNEPLGPDETRGIRTFQRWKKSAREAKANLGWSLIGLLPDVSFRGNRGSKVGEEHEKLAAKAIESIENPDRKSFQFAYQTYAVACEEKGETPMSEKSFSIRLRQKPLQKFIESREGHKVAYQVGGFVPAFERDPFRHGVHPWDFAHIDHTQVPLFLGSPMGLEWKEKPWLTLIVATQCRRVLGFYLTFDPPSYVSCMMALREIIRRFGRLPKTVVVDGGKDFRSTDFEVFLARCESGRKTRPPHQPRFGSMIESALGLTIEQLFNNLEGNSQATRERTMTDATDPRNRVRFTLTELHAVLRKFLYEIYDQSPHSGIGCSPREAYENGLKTGGAREHVPVPWSQEILYLSSPSVPGGTRKVIYRKGIEVFGIDYYSFELDANGVPDTKVEVRYDPDNAGHVFAFANGRWVRCLSEHHQVFERWTVKEVAIASATLREKERSKRTSRGERMKNLVRYFQSGEFLDEIRDRKEKAVETALSTPELRIPKEVSVGKRSDKPPSRAEPKGDKSTTATPAFKRVVYGRFRTE